jgi:hypothetical protein
VNKRPRFFPADFLSVWAAASLLPTPYSAFFSICTLHAQGPKHACHAFTTFELCYELKYVALNMAATLWTPNFQISLEKVHKTGKQGLF